MTTGKTIALTRQTFVGKVMSLLFNMLSRLVITFLLSSRQLLISWLQSPSAVILEPPKIKFDTASTVSPSISHEVMGVDATILAATEQQWVKEEIKNLERNENGNKTLKKSVTHKSSSKREVYSEKGLPQETRKIPSKQSNLTHKTRKRVGTLHPPSDVYVRSFLCPFSFFNKTATQKFLSDQEWSLVPKLNLLLRS